MDKNRFETQKEVVNSDLPNIPLLFTVDDLKWLIEQAELVEELEDELVKSDEKTNSMVSEIIGLKEKIVDLDNALVEYDANITCNAVKIGKLKQKVAELEKEREGFKQFLRRTSDIDKRADERIEELERLVEKERNGQNWLLKKWKQCDEENKEYRKALEKIAFVPNVKSATTASEVLEKFTKKNVLKSYDGDDLGNDF